MGKPGFMLYHADLSALAKLSDSQLGALVRALCVYSVEGTLPAIEDPSVDVAFALLSDKIARDSKNYAATVEKRREAGRIAAKRREQMLARVDTCQQIRLTGTPNGTLTGNGSLSLTPSQGEDREREKPTLEMVEEYAREAGLEVDARQFIAQNEATGWTDGNGQPVKNWRIWLQGWALRNRPGGAAKPTPTAMAFEQRTYTGDELKAMTDAMFEDALQRLHGT